MQRVARFPEKMRNRGFHDFEMAVMTLNPLVMKLREVLLAFDRHVFMPLFANLLEEEVPLRVDAVPAGRLRSEITQRIAGQGPPFEKPPAGFLVRATDPFAELIEKRADRQAPIHGPKKRGTHPVQLDQGQVFIQGRDPPFLISVLVDHEVRHTPSPLLENFTLQGKGFKGWSRRGHASFSSSFGRG